MATLGDVIGTTLGDAVGGNLGATVGITFVATVGATLVKWAGVGGTVGSTHGARSGVGASVGGSAGWPVVALVNLNFPKSACMLVISSSWALHAMVGRSARAQVRMERS